MGEVVGGLFGMKAADKQADAMEDAADKASETQRYMFDESVKLSAPWREGGQNALQALQYELGLGGTERPMLGQTTRFQVGDRSFETREEAEEYRSSLGGGGGTEAGANPATTGGGGANLVWSDKDARWVRPQPWQTGIPRFNEDGDFQGFTDETGMRQVGGATGGGGGGDIPSIEEVTSGGQRYLGFQETPGYGFQLDEGQRAINRSLAARGRSLSGAAVKEGMRFGQGLADQTYSNHLARLAQLSGLGGGVAQQQGKFAIGTGEGLAKTAMSAGAQIGNARGSGYAALGQGIGGGINSLAGFAGFGSGGGTFGAGNSAFGSFGSFMSDRRLKADVARIGETAEGYPKYRFRYLWDAPGTVRVGVMADEVPKELTFDVGGYKAVNYAEVTL